MKHKILFNRYTSICCNNDHELNKMFIVRSINYIKDTIDFRGYIYLNQIYEHFGINWYPNADNPCFIRKPNKTTQINITYDGSVDDFEIIITW